MRPGGHRLPGRRWAAGPARGGRAVRCARPTTRRSASADIAGAEPGRREPPVLQGVRRPGPARRADAAGGACWTGLLGGLPLGGWRPELTADAAAVTETRTRDEIDALADGLDGLSVSGPKPGRRASLATARQCAAMGPLLFELRSAGPADGPARCPRCDVPARRLDELLPARAPARAHAPPLPEVARARRGPPLHGLSADELRASTSASIRSGSCTMKYNPKVHEDGRGLPGFARLHPLPARRARPGRAASCCASWSGACARSPAWRRPPCSPPAGAHGELTGLLLMRAYHEPARRERDAQGRHPGLGPRHQPGQRHPGRLRGGRGAVRRARGWWTWTALRGRARRRRGRHHADQPQHPGPVRGGHRRDRRAVVHEVGGLLYYDGANLNAILGVVPPGRHGLRHRAHEPAQDLRHARTAAGGRAPARSRSRSTWRRSCPAPVRAREDGDGYLLDYDRPRVDRPGARLHGNVGVLARAYAYILGHGRATGCARWARTRCSTPTSCGSRLRDALRHALRPPVHARVRGCRPRPEASAAACGPWTWPSACSTRASTRPRSTSR